ASRARQPERLEHLTVVRIELARAHQLTARRGIVPEHLAVVEPELVPAGPVQRLEVDRLRVELARPRELPRILLDRGPGLERRDRERVQRVRALRRRRRLPELTTLDLRVRVVDPGRRDPRRGDRVEAGPRD